jgi:hypothetical protein
MKANMGSADRWIRFILGIGLILLFFFTAAPIKYVGILGIIFVVTALIKWCPLYTLFGFNTKGK